MAPRSSRSRDTVAWVATTPSAASSSTSCAWLVTGVLLEQARRSRCWRWGLAEPGRGRSRSRPAHASARAATQQRPGRRACGCAACATTRLRGPSITVGGDLLAPVGGQAVQEDGAGRRPPPSARSSTVKPSKARRRAVGLGLLAHRRPHVGVARRRRPSTASCGRGASPTASAPSGRGCGRGRRRRGRSRAGRPTRTCMPRHAPRRGRASGPRCCSRRRRRRCGPSRLAELLAHGEQVGQRLAAGGPSSDSRLTTGTRAGAGHALERRVVEDPGADARRGSRRGCGRRPRPSRGRRGRPRRRRTETGWPPSCTTAISRRVAGAGRRLLEEQGDARARRATGGGSGRSAQVEHRGELVGREVVDLEEVPVTRHAGQHRAEDGRRPRRSRRR